MIILIGGSSHVGKTYLAQKLMEKYNFPYTSIDHLKMGFIRTGLTDLTVEDDDEMTYFIWPYVAEIVKTAIENDQNMIIEGCYIPREWRESFDEEYLNHIRCVFIVMTEHYIRNNFDVLVNTASVIERRLDDDPDMERLIKCSFYKKQDAIESKAYVYEIDEKYDIDAMVEFVSKIMEEEK